MLILEGISLECGDGSWLIIISIQMESPMSASGGGLTGEQARSAMPNTVSRHPNTEIET